MLLPWHCSNRVGWVGRTPTMMLTEECAKVDMAEKEGVSTRMMI